MTRRTGMRPLRIAMIGQKGIPARYGGVETHVENLAVRLVERGHEVTAFCRSRFRPDGDALPDGFVDHGASASYRGVRLLYRSSINTKHLDAASHSFLCALEAGTRHGFDIVHLHGVGPAAFAPVARAFGRPVVSTFHALDWRQVKWGPRAKSVLRRGEAVGARRSDGIIAVSLIMKQHVQEAYGIDAVHIPNGASPRALRGVGGIARWGLEGDDYILTVGRIIRDREIHTLIEAFNGLDNGLRLVVVGSENPRTEYSDELERAADGRVVFTGEVFGEAVEDLYANCRVFVLASRVEGLPISVCEAMAHARALVLSDIPENREVGGEAARFFKCGDVSSLRETLDAVLKDDAARLELGRRGVERVQETYNWDAVANRVESFYYQVLER